MQVKIRLGIMLATRHPGNNPSRWDASQRILGHQEHSSKISRTSAEGQNPLFLSTPHSGNTSESGGSDKSAAAAIKGKLRGGAMPVGESVHHPTGRSKSASPMQGLTRQNLQATVTRAGRDNFETVKRSARSLSPKKGPSLPFLGGSKREDELTPPLTPADFIHAVCCALYLLKKSLYAMHLHTMSCAGYRKI
jgi:hypothetical protein